MHGGLSPDLNSMEQIRRIMRPTDVPDTGLLCDLLWSDPDEKITGCVVRARVCVFRCVCVSVCVSCSFFFSVCVCVAFSLGV